MVDTAMVPTEGGEAKEYSKPFLSEPLFHRVSVAAY